MEQAAKPKLSIENISLHFGGLRALDTVSFHVQEPGIYSIIGPNGAGKTCMLNCINGFYRPTSGNIIFKTSNITHIPSHSIARMGIARTFQNLKLYTGMTVIDNIMTGRHMLMRYGTIPALFYYGKAKKEELAHKKEMERVIEFLGIQEVKDRIVGTLPYGLRKKVELGRALALDPEILLLDEPMAGMDAEEKEQMAGCILEICKVKQIPVILIEHDMGVVMSITDRITVLDFGHKIAEGSPDEIKMNPLVISAYLGRKADNSSQKVNKK